MEANHSKSAQQMFDNLAGVSEGVREKAETFEERDELLRERFADAAD